ncbi:hypothetical protein SRABI106_03612 [Rahnella aquatilis]|nr:hypothetical protein SRABI106_03612 [Rahnella aquatilis]
MAENIINILQSVYFNGEHTKTTFVFLVILCDGRVEYDCIRQPCYRIMTFNPMKILFSFHSPCYFLFHCFYSHKRKNKPKKTCYIQGNENFV